MIMICKNLECDNSKLKPNCLVECYINTCMIIGFNLFFFILLETNQNILYSAVIGNLAWHIFLGWDMKICNYSCWKNVSKYQKGGFYILDIIISPFYLYWMFVNFNVIPCKCKNREENYE